MIHSVYKTTNAVNGKFYIGKHSSIDPDDAYIGSGTVLLRAVKKHGRQNFTKVVLKEFLDEVDAYRYEREVIEGIGINNPDCYNACHGGVGFWKGMKHSAETKAKMSSSQRGKVMSEEAKAKMSRARTGAKLSAATKSKLSKLNTGKTLSIETRVKIGIAGTGKVRSDESRKNISRGKKGLPSWHKGKERTPETREKMSLSRTGIKLSDATKSKIRDATTGDRNAGYGKIWITDSATNLRISSTEEIPAGWRRGRTLRPYSLKIKEN